MKKHLILPVLLLWVVSAFGQEGIRFETGTLDEVLAKAKAENKLVFLDAYTEWCGPCKYMAKNVFPLASVGEVFNKHFINYTMDMEKGEGVAFAKANAIQAYPTLLFLNPDGTVYDRRIGARREDDLISLAKEITAPGYRTLSARYQEFLAGNRDPKFMREYILANYFAGNQPDSVGKAYLPLLAGDGLLDPDNYRLLSILGTQHDSPVFRTAFAMRDKLAATHSNKKVLEELIGILSYNIQQLYQEKQDATADSLMVRMQEINSPAAKRTAMDIRGSRLFDAGDYDGYVALINETVKEKAYSPSGLNNSAYFLAQNSDDAGHLKECLRWIDLSIKAEESTYNLDSKAFILHKMGKRSEAIKCMKKAIVVGEAAGEDVTASKEMLAEWQAE